jgi:hypothetical protein
MLIEHELVMKRQRKLEAIKQGFFYLEKLMPIFKSIILCLGPALLQRMVEGVRKIDPDELLSNFIFDPAVWKDSTTPQHFKQVVQSLSQKNLCRLLRLTTSLNALPVNGLQVKVTVQRSTAVWYLPVGHTCHHVLDLPEYSTAQLLKNKLIIALEHIDHTGFGYV